MTVNDGYFDFFQNWIHFYNKLQLNFPLIVIAEDDDVFLKLHQLNTQSVFTLVRSWRNTLRSAVVYGSKEFNELASGRPTYILTYLETGTNILYADTDSVWLHDPFPYFQGTFDMWMQVDGPGNLCTGLIAIKSNNESIKLMRLWEAALKKRLDIGQTVFNQVFTNSTIHLKPLDRNLFPSGNIEKVRLDARKLSRPFGISQQFPVEVMERRRKLVPVMLDRKDGKEAYLAADKLYIDEHLYRDGATSGSG
ncbi:uncharacterized protein LOC132756234 [Ruditapes philippinarum]|uniref:uncharacterized protein LOC132756234 n=1 Tax=Ruditapes philippinarum TaxID=129788 RepID=UPI00295BDAFC|nr:uncharacterized protein LOC132756234 [Ruditapes philippinarum]